jgi:hypothetical protein
VSRAYVFDRLIAQRERGISVASDLLRTAADRTTDPALDDSEGYAATATALTSAASLARTAADELTKIAAAFELAGEVAEARILEEGSANDG